MRTCVWFSTRFKVVITTITSNINEPGRRWAYVFVCDYLGLGRGRECYDDETTI